MKRVFDRIYKLSWMFGLTMVLGMSTFASAMNVTITMAPATPGEAANDPILICKGDSAAMINLTAQAWSDKNSPTPDTDQNILKECTVAPASWSWTGVDGYSGTTAYVTPKTTVEGSQSINVTAKVSYTITPKQAGATGCTSPVTASKTITIYVCILSTSSSYTTFYTPNFAPQQPPAQPYNYDKVGTDVWSDEPVEDKKSGTVTYTLSVDPCGGPWESPCGQTVVIDEKLILGLTCKASYLGITLTGGIETTTSVHIVVPVVAVSHKQFNFTWLQPKFEVNDVPTKWTTRSGTEKSDGTIDWDDWTDDTPTGPQFLGYLFGQPDFLMEARCCAGG